MSNPNLQRDWQAYWASTKPGSKVDWAGGTLQRLDDGRAFYSSPNATNGGQMLTPDMDLNALAQSNQGVAQLWDQQYGFKPAGDYFFDSEVVRQPDLYSHTAKNQYGLDANGAPVKSSIPVLDGSSHEANMAALIKAGYLNAAGDGPGALLSQASTPYTPASQPAAQPAPGLERQGQYFGTQPTSGAGVAQPSSGADQPTSGAGQPTPVGGSTVLPGNVYGGGQGYPQGYPQPPAVGAAQPSQFNTPVLDALYAAQQQRMTSPAPQFNFQQHLKRGGPVVGALTRVIRGK